MNLLTGISDEHIFSVIMFIIMTRHFIFIPSIPIVILSVFTHEKISSMYTERK